MITTMALFTLAATLFYHYEKHRLLNLQRDVLKQDAENFIFQIRHLHESMQTKLPYPINKNFHSAIFDIDKRFIFGDFQPEKSLLSNAFSIQHGKLTYTKEVAPYYLGAAYLILQKPLDQAPLQALLEHTVLFLIAAFFIFLLLGLFLGRLFIAPMRHSFEKMNHFIQDTTHELNTPISTILANIELLDTLYECGGTQEHKRIEIASKTLSRLYDDMTYLTLNHEYHRDIQPCHISTLLQERLNYFSTMIEAKRVQLHKDIATDITIMIDENDAIRLIDNLLSNAIKYNRQNGYIAITLNSKQLIIEDGGVGMNKEDLKKIFKRFERTNKSEGGFGIGMDIVKQITTFYHYEITIHSEVEKGTKVSISWSK
jgi:two-component system OmpR family sensor kinase